LKNIKETGKLKIRRELKRSENHRGVKTTKTSEKAKQADLKDSIQNGREYRTRHKQNWKGNGSNEQYR
jgi:hypothetical protein